VRETLDRSHLREPPLPPRPRLLLSAGAHPTHLALLPDAHSSLPRERRSVYADMAVVVTNYNYENYIIRALESVYNQTYLRPLELIIIDDCSTDNSVAVITDWVQRYKTRFAYVALYSTGENSGLSRARNLGFTATFARLVMVLDADNYLLPPW
jgi:cellulose synthase/poly-beta-1,6-N-acetylglucosamine synthase-like glycosyltransferase